MSRFSGAFLMMLVLVTGALGQGETWLTEQLEPIYYTPASDVEILQLDNGLQVVLLPNPAQAMVGIYCQVKVGSAWEDFATSGMSHMLEHLLFNGTEKYTQEELYAAADLAGAYNNAHTTDFYTDFMMVLPAERMETGLDLQSQMLFHSLIPEEKFGKEQGIVLGELAMSRDRGDPFADTVLRQALFGGTSLELPTLGTTSTIAAMDRDEVAAFYHRWYAPNNMILTLAGRFDRSEALELVEQYYGSVAPRTLPQVDQRLMPHFETSQTLVRRGGGQRKLTLSFEAPDYQSPDYFAFLAASELLSAEGTGILTRALEDLPVEERPELSTWWQAAPGFSHLVLDFELPMGTDPSPLYRLVQNAITGTLEMGVQDAALAEVLAMQKTSTLKQREQLRMTGIYIAEPLVLGGPDFMVSSLGRLAAVTAVDVDRALRTWLVDQPCLAILVEPATDGSVATVATGEAPVERSLLPSGAVLVSQTNVDSDLMAVHVTVRSRALLDQRVGKAGALNMAHRLLSYGVGGCDEACVAQRLRRLGAEIKVMDDPRFPMDDYYTNGLFSFIRVECAAENGTEVLALISEVLQHSTFTDDDLEVEKAAMGQLLGRRATSASRQAGRLLAEGLYGDHPLAMPAEGSVASVQDLSFDDVRDVYRRAFMPENLILAVVSPYSHETLKSMLPGLPGSGNRTPDAMPPLPETSAPERLTATLDGPMAAIRLGAIRTIDPQDQPALEMLVAVLSERLVMDLRETRGLSYSVGAGLKVVGDRAVLTARLNPPTPRLAEGEEALATALREFDAGSVTQEELDKVRAARQGRLMMRRLDSISRAYYLAMAELNGDVTAYLHQIPAYDEVGLADLQRVASFFSELPLITVVVD